MFKDIEGKQKIICIVGPTASGKTGLAIQLAKKISAEIISADSMQIYKSLNIGTAKVTEGEMQGIPHHMIDICDIDEKYNVADFKEECYNLIEEISKRNKNVIIVGGTGLYISAVVNDMQFEEKEVDEEYRKELTQLAKENSNEYVHDILRSLDKEASEKIHPNNLKRVIRAIEYAKFLSKNKSQHMEDENKRIDLKDQKYRFEIFQINVERDLLYERINYRVDEMIKGGLLDEAKMVYDKKLPKDLTCMQAIGYKEFFDYFENNKTLAECVDKLKQETRRYAKRQITWFKNMLKVNMLDATKTKDELCIEILEKLDEK